jgi:hypothetical protein
VIDRAGVFDDRWVRAQHRHGEHQGDVARWRQLARAAEGNRLRDTRELAERGIGLGGP